MNGYIVPGRARELFTPDDLLHLRKALVTARRVELGHAKTARRHKDTATQAQAVLHLPSEDTEGGHVD